MSITQLLAVINRHKVSASVGAFQTLMLGLSPWIYYRFSATSPGTECTDLSGNGQHANFCVPSSLTPVIDVSTTKPSATSLVTTAPISDKALQRGLFVYGTYATMPTGTGDWTLQIIVKPTEWFTSGSRNHVLAVGGPAVGGAPIICLNPEPGLGQRFRPYVENWYVAAPIMPAVAVDKSIALNDKAILHLRYIAATASNELYMNGGLVASATQAWPDLGPGSAKRRLWIGFSQHPIFSYDSSGQLFRGDVDEAAVFRYALSPSQIATVAAAAFA